MSPGALVRSRRLELGLSQRRLARRAGTTQAAISRIERGLERVTWERLEAILLAIGEEPLLSSWPIDPEVDPRALAEQATKPPAERLREGLAWSRFASRVHAAGAQAQGR